MRCEVTLPAAGASAGVGGRAAVPSDEIGTLRYERPEQLAPAARAAPAYYTFPGGCVTLPLRVRPGVASPALVFAADQALAFQDRSLAGPRGATTTPICGSAVPVPVPGWSRRDDGLRSVTGPATRSTPDPAHHALGPRVPRVSLVRARGLTLCALIARTGRSARPSASVFHAINDLPGWLYPILWPFQQFGNLLVALVVGVVIALALRKWWVAVAVVAAVVLKLAVRDAR